jgi:hypothetical protein
MQSLELRYRVNQLRVKGEGLGNIMKGFGFRVHILGLRARGSKFGL